MAARWEYKSTTLIDPEDGGVNRHLRQISDEGWELVCGNVDAAVYVRSGQGLAAHFHYTQYWRRPVS